MLVTKMMRKMHSLIMHHCQVWDGVISIILWNIWNKGTFQPCLHHQISKARYTATDGHHVHTDRPWTCMQPFRSWTWDGKTAESHTYSGTLLGSLRTLIQWQRKDLGWSSSCFSLVTSPEESESNNWEAFMQLVSISSHPFKGNQRIVNLPFNVCLL